MTAEGLLQRFHCSKKLREAARAAGKTFNAAPVKHSGLPTDALIPMVRGFHALTITSEGKQERDEETLLSDDSPLDLDDVELMKAADFTEELIRLIESKRL